MGAISCASEGGDEASTPSTVTATPGASNVPDQGDGNAQAVVLLFEVDEDGARTDGVLRTLRERLARATFVVTGVWAEAHRDTLLSISSEGHQIINGTYEGRSWTGSSTGETPMTPAERKLALSRAEVTVYRYTSQSTLPYFAPPYSDVNESVSRDAEANGYGVVVVPEIVVGEGAAPADVIDDVEAGAVVGVAAGVDAARVDAIVEGISAGGYGFITIGEMAR
jgi:peptidoglycan/xylan/chitin deacetylase (PgdA/CDA1 family)